jgi:LacI family transcriptional regulator
MADSGYTQTLDLLALSERPTAIFCGTVRMAMGAYDALKESGLRIPEDVAIVGFDNQELIAAYLRPALSTIALPHYEMGRWAVEHLLEHPHVPPEAPVQHRIPCPLVERDSA